MPRLPSGWTIGLARSSKLVAGIAAIALVAACGSDSTTGPSGSSNPVGSYTMSTVNGKAVPTSLFADGPFSYDITGGTMKLTNDGKFSAVTKYRQTVPGSVENFVDSIAGTWTQSGSSLQMTIEDGSTASATFDKSTLTLSASDAGVTLTVVYGNKK